MPSLADAVPNGLDYAYLRKIGDLSFPLVCSADFILQDIFIVTNNFPILKTLCKVQDGSQNIFWEWNFLIQFHFGQVHFIADSFRVSFVIEWAILGICEMFWRFYDNYGVSNQLIDLLVMSFDHITRQHVTTFAMSYFIYFCIFVRDLTIMWFFSRSLFVLISK